MNPQSHIKRVIALLAASMAIEVNLLAGIGNLPDAAYHGLHVALMAALVASQFALYLSARPTSRHAAYAFWFALGMAATTIGDYVNGAMSGVEPASLKLSWALLLFGAGYSVYVWVMWRHDRELMSTRGAGQGWTRYGFALAVPIAAFNLLAWIKHVEPGVAAHALLYYGSFVFNLTIYVAMPLLALRYARHCAWQAGGLIVLVGALLLPYSDLILFGSWLRGGADPAVPSFELYAYNWIVYFSGQALMSLFPALVMQAGSIESRSCQGVLSFRRDAGCD